MSLYSTVFFSKAKRKHERLRDEFNM